MNWWHYLLLVNFYLVLFFGFYVLLLRRETFFQLNRVYLVAASLLSFFIPLIQSDWIKNLFITQAVQATIYSSPVIMVYNITPATQSSLTIGTVLNAVYIAVTLFLVLRLIWQLAILKKVIEKPSPSAAYSFFKKISLGNNLANPGVIAEHEQVHARQWHSVDVLIIETVMIINWFNPVVYLYRFAIKYIHEFIADKQVIQSGTNRADYALLLLNQTFEVPVHRLVTPFYNNSILKQRIMMLQKNRSQRIALAKYGLSAPLFALMLIFSSATVNNSKAVTAINKKTEKVFLTPADDVVPGITNNAEMTELPVIRENAPLQQEPVFSAVETQPEFPGGVNGFQNFLIKNIHYPAVDREKKIQGEVFVSFIVEKNGKLSGVKAVHGPSKSMEQEAVRVLAMSPKWKPGIENNRPVRVSFTVPINFSLNLKTGLNKKAASSLNGTAQADKNIVFTAVEKQPQFPGGVDNFIRFLTKTIHYPAAMRENKVQGKVYVQFIVEADGSLSGIKAIHGPGYGSEQEAERAMALSPKWEPGYQNGRAVRVEFTVPVNFTLENGIGAVNGMVPDHKAIPFNAQLEPKSVDFTNYIAKAGEPVIVIDGVARDKTAMNAIDRNSIEYLSILKDASTDKYGVNAKNGVIIITTKKADDQPKIKKS